MIRNEVEYQEAVTRIQQEAERIEAQRQELEALNLNHEEVERALGPIRSFHEQFKEEVASYERLKRGEFEEVENFYGVGRLLIALRLAQGVSQRELAKRLGVHESQVSRDERNEYHGVTLDRANRILDALGVDLRTQVVRLERNHGPNESVSA
ncbi:helix-turn-helix domain-containing protein [Bremerella sp.]|uniref:helix-turn-helix domain-containing protein n=1 Tax=Bremerella sp. TaxID=2795602 RepID=UPI00391DF7C0